MSETESLDAFDGPLTDEQWEILGTFLNKIPRKVRLVVWAAELNSCTEESGVDLVRALTDRFEMLEMTHRPRQKGFPYYPLIGIMGIEEDGKDIDFRIRFIGLPAWYHINSLIGAIQAVSFRGQTLEAKTRIQLSRLNRPVQLELFTIPEDEAGVEMVTLIANLAVVSDKIKAHTIMVNDFPTLATHYSVYEVPKLLINDWHHITGVIPEERLMTLIGKTLKKEAEQADTETP